MDDNLPPGMSPEDLDDLDLPEEEEDDMDDDSDLEDDDREILYTGDIDL